jgi:hypothetical protein
MRGPLGRAQNDSPEAVVKRRFGITVLALLLYWLSLGGFAMAILAPNLRELGVPWAWYRLAGLLYGLLAVASATGLWRLAPWSSIAFAAWAAVAIAAGILPALTLPNADVPWWVIPLGIVLAAAIFVPLGHYIRRSVPAPA